MLIDWFTVGAQLINFLVLVWLLKRFLYRPVLDAIDAREKKIAAELAQAASAEQAAQQERLLYTQQQQQLDHEREQVLQQARDKAKAESAQIVAQAREAAAALKTRQQNTLAAEQAALASELARRTRAEVFALARDALHDMADSELEAQLLQVFIRRLQDAENSASLRAQLAHNGQQSNAIVTSAFPLQPAQQQLIGSVLQHSLQRELALQFELQPALLAGIELTIGGYKLGWSLNSYLSGLQEKSS